MSGILFFNFASCEPLIIIKITPNVEGDIVCASALMSPKTNIGFPSDFNTFIVQIH